MLNTKNANSEAARQALLMKISEYRFAALETALYLDTHPNDSATLMRHNEFCKMLKESCEEYHMIFNDPLNIYQPANDYWSYIERWPVGLDCYGCGREAM